MSEKYHADFTIEMKYDIENKGVYAVASPKTINFDQRTNTLLICKNQDWNQKRDDEKKGELLKIQKLADYLEEYHLPVLVQILYETKDDKRHNTIYISREGEIVK
ncbi:hypothetical protein V7146_21475 [Gottfriedia acidiceleris]|uniref:hypothetical protein n=1 Tax=Gottfriedia acidiceleris TaxID=371036 RepID=UPI003000ED21